MHHRRERALKPRKPLRFEEEPCSWTALPSAKHNHFWGDAVRALGGLATRSLDRILGGWWSGGGRVQRSGGQERKIHAPGAPPDDLTRDALPTLCDQLAPPGRSPNTTPLIHIQPSSASGGLAFRYLNPVPRNKHTHTA